MARLQHAHLDETFDHGVDRHRLVRRLQALERLKAHGTAHSMAHVCAVAAVQA
jgi:hypothetical protein